MGRRTLAVAAVATVLLGVAGGAGTASSAPPGQSAPVNTTLPSIGGSATVGGTLTGNVGTWTGPNPTFALQWLRCDAAGSACSPIGSATGDAYGLSAGDVGSTLRLAVTATNKNGSAISTSNATSSVTGASTPTTTTTTTTAATTTTPTTTTTTTTTPTTTTTTTTSTTTTTTITGCSAPTQLSARWYACSSAFNEPIPTGAPYRPNDGSIINAMVTKWCVNSCIRPIGGGGFAAYFATASTPLVTVNVYPNGTSCTPTKTFRVPIPAGTVGPFEHNSGAIESHLNIMLPDGTEWDIWRERGPGYPANSFTSACGNNPPGTWSSAITYHADPAAGLGGWLGQGNESYDSRASGTYDGTGVIRPRDTSQPAGATWDHALAFAWGGNLPQTVWPAKGGGDGPCGDTNACVPEGARFQLDPAFDCTGSTLLTYEWERQMCRTLQKYGMIVVDTACISCGSGGIMSEDGWSVSQPNGDNNGVAGYQFPYESTGYLPLGLEKHMHVIDWTQWTG